MPYAVCIPSFLPGELNRWGPLQAVQSQHAEPSVQAPVSPRKQFNLSTTNISEPATLSPQQPVEPSKTWQVFCKSLSGFMQKLRPGLRRKGTDSGTDADALRKALACRVRVQSHART